MTRVIGVVVSISNHDRSSVQLIPRDATSVVPLDILIEYVEAREMVKVEKKYPTLQQRQQQQQANQLVVEHSYVNEELFVVESDKGKQGQKFYAHLTIVETNRSKVVRAQIGSASTCNTIPVDTLYQLFPNIKIDKTKAACTDIRKSENKTSGESNRLLGEEKETTSTRVLGSGCTSRKAAVVKWSRCTNPRIFGCSR